MTLQEARFSRDAFAPDSDEFPRHLQAAHSTGSDANIALALFNLATLRHNRVHLV
jgi:hypothetical protein